MRKHYTVGLVAILVFASTVGTFAKKKEQQSAPSTASTGFPAPYTKAVKGAERFENSSYFILMASDGIRKVDAKALYSRLQAAVAANERYKALYLARIFTELEPGAAAAWSNRAQLASALGLTDEASACEQNAKNPSQHTPVPVANILPGTALKVKPTTLSDWAAATALLSDGIAEKDGKQALVAYKDLVSGVHEATKEEIDERTRDNQEAGMNAPGPWATAEPVQLRHVLANVFDLNAADPMHNKSMATGGMFAALALSGLSGFQQGTNPALAQETMNVAEEMAGRASEVPSRYKGGAYTRVVFEDGKEVATPDHPQTSGEYETVGEPVPFLWASGGSTEPYFSGYWKSNQGMKVKKITASNLDDLGNSHAKRYSPPVELRFPKLMSLCTANGPDHSSCSNSLSLMEVLLTREDVASLAPELAASVVDVDAFRQSYDSATLVIEAGNGGGHLQWGADNDGAIYQLSPEPTAWLVGAR